MLKQGEENQINNVRKREKQIEEMVLNSINKMEDAVALINPKDEDMKWNVIKDYSNPTKEEINQQLSTIPAIQAYYNNMKVYAQLLYDIAEHELFVAQVNAREEYKVAYQQRLAKYQDDIANSMKDALRSTAQDKAMVVIKEMVKTLKPKEPTDKEFESFIKGKTAEIERKVLIHKYRVHKLREFCKVLENKFLSARALRYSIDGMNKADVNATYNN